MPWRQSLAAPHARLGARAALAIAPRVARLVDGARAAGAAAAIDVALGAVLHGVGAARRRAFEAARARAALAIAALIARAAGGAARAHARAGRGAAAIDVALGAVLDGVGAA